MRASLGAYRSAFESFGLTWQKGRRIAVRFRDRVADYAPEAFEEIRGIAAGANVDPLDVLALNLRTEILAAVDAPRAVGECTAFAVLPDASANGNVLLAQNWDWMLHSQQTVVVLKVERDDAPAFTTIVEAGLVAKIGLNSSAIGIATNALRAAGDPVDDGIPYHILLRRLFDAPSLNDAVALLEGAQHASSANFMIASADGTAVDLEAEAGDVAGPRSHPARDGILAHTNHFLTEGAHTVDHGPSKYASTLSRLETGRALIDRSKPITIETLQQALADHDGYPLSVCAHPDPIASSAEQGLTAASLIIDLTTIHTWLADGNPCSHPFREIDCSWLRRRSESSTRLQAQPATN